jgi:hypothetical protein
MCWCLIYKDKIGGNTYITFNNLLYYSAFYYHLHYISSTKTYSCAAYSLITVVRMTSHYEDIEG